eukprot:ANDGO_04637.mRNA.1 hypothetical protein
MWYLEFVQSFSFVMLGFRTPLYSIVDSTEFFEAEDAHTDSNSPNLEILVVSSTGTLNGLLIVTLSSVLFMLFVLLCLHFFSFGLAFSIIVARYVRHCRSTGRSLHLSDVCRLVNFSKLARFFDSLYFTVFYAAAYPIFVAISLTFFVAQSASMLILALVAATVYVLVVLLAIAPSLKRGPSIKTKLDIAFHVYPKDLWFVHVLNISIFIFDGVIVAVGSQAGMMTSSLQICLLAGPSFLRLLLALVFIPAEMMKDKALGILNGILDVVQLLLVFALVGKSRSSYLTNTLMTYVAWAQMVVVIINICVSVFEMVLAVGRFLKHMSLLVSARIQRVGSDTTQKDFKDKIDACPADPKTVAEWTSNDSKFLLRTGPICDLDSVSETDSVSFPGTSYSSSEHEGSASCRSRAISSASSADLHSAPVTPSTTSNPLALKFDLTLRQDSAVDRNYQRSLVSLRDPPDDQCTIDAFGNPVPYHSPFSSSAVEIALRTTSVKKTKPVILLDANDPENKNPLCLAFSQPPRPSARQALVPIGMRALKRSISPQSAAPELRDGGASSSISPRKVAASDLPSEAFATPNLHIHAPRNPVCVPEDFAPPTLSSATSSWTLPNISVESAGHSNTNPLAKPFADRWPFPSSANVSSSRPGLTSVVPKYSMDHPFPLRRSSGKSKQA